MFAKKKWLSLLLTLCFLVTLIPMTALPVSADYDIYDSVDFYNKCYSASSGVIFPPE